MRTWSSINHTLLFLYVFHVNWNFNFLVEFLAFWYILQIKGNMINTVQLLCSWQLCISLFWTEDLKNDNIYVMENNFLIMLHGCTQITFKYLFLPFLLFLAFFVSFVILLHRLRKWLTFTDLNLDTVLCFSFITSYKISRLTYAFYAFLWTVIVYLQLCCEHDSANTLQFLWTAYTDFSFPSQMRLHTWKND